MLLIKKINCCLSSKFVLKAKHAWERFDVVRPPAFIKATAGGGSASILKYDQKYQQVYKPKQKAKLENTSTYKTL